VLSWTPAQRRQRASASPMRAALAWPVAGAHARLRLTLLVGAHAQTDGLGPGKMTER
jgi:hypothetical protein